MSTTIKQNKDGVCEHNFIEIDGEVTKSDKCEGELQYRCIKTGYQKIFLSSI